MTTRKEKSQEKNTAPSHIYVDSVCFNLRITLINEATLELYKK